MRACRTRARPLPLCRGAGGGHLRALPVGDPPTAIRWSIYCGRVCSALCLPAFWGWGWGWGKACRVLRGVARFWSVLVASPGRAPCPAGPRGDDMSCHRTSFCPFSAAAPVLLTRILHRFSVQAIAEAGGLPPPPPSGLRPTTFFVWRILFAIARSVRGWPGLSCCCTFRAVFGGVWKGLTTRLQTHAEMSGIYVAGSLGATPGGAQ